MLQNWLTALRPALLKSVGTLPEYSLGKNIMLHGQQMPALKGVRIALIGANEKEANAVRAHLYRAGCFFPKDAIADLGNLRRAEPDMLMPVIYELLSGKVLPIILAQHDELARAHFLAYQEARSLVNLTVIDERLRMARAEPENAVADAVYTPLLQPRHPLLFHFGLVGCQTHQMTPEGFDFLGKHYFDTVRLGKSRTSIEETEPVLRDADLIVFHLDALKQCEAPGVENASPSGYFTEEACQLCRYAGMSDKLTSFGIYGYHLDHDVNEQTAKTVGQMIWYFLEGYFNRKNDFPASKDGMTEYIVDFRGLNYQLTFWKSARSGRWWMQTPVATRKKHQRHYLIPCSFQDYQAACREELPDRLLQALSRFG